MGIEGVDPGLMFFLERIPKRTSETGAGKTKRTAERRSRAVEISTRADGGRVAGAQYERAAEFLLFLRGTLDSAREVLGRMRDTAGLPIKHPTQPIRDRWAALTSQLDSIASSEFEGSAAFEGDTRSLALPSGGGALAVPTADLRAKSLGVLEPHPAAVTRALAVVENMGSVLEQKTGELSRASAPSGPDGEVDSIGGVQDVLLQNASAAVRAQTGALEPGLAFSLLRGL